MENTEELNISLEEIQKLNKETRIKVLEKHPDDIELDDLSYITPYDAVFSKLPYRYKQIIKLRDDSEVIFSQLGKDILALLEDKNVNEINLNQDGYIRIDMFGRGKFKTDIFMDADRAENMIKLIADYNNESISKENPIISTNLPTGERIECLLGNVVKGSPVFSLRKRPIKIFPLTEYVESGRLKEEYRKALVEEIQKGANILIGGGVGTGKTTLANACINELKGTRKRIIIIEDTPEIICDCDDKVELTTTKYVKLSDLLKTAMRLNGDTVIVGESRTGQEVDTLLKIWNSGSKGGFNTIHADNAQSALKKMEQYMMTVTAVPQIEEIIQAVDIVVSVKKDMNSSIYVNEIAKLKGYDYANRRYILEDLVTKEVYERKEESINV